jgi:hypothetical protein
LKPLRIFSKPIALHAVRDQLGSVNESFHFDGASVYAVSRDCQQYLFKMLGARHQLVARLLTTGRVTFRKASMKEGDRPRM